MASQFTHFFDSSAKRGFSPTVSDAAAGHDPQSHHQSSSMVAQFSIQPEPSTSALSTAMKMMMHTSTSQGKLHPEQPFQNKTSSIFGTNPAPAQHHTQHQTPPMQHSQQPNMGDAMSHLQPQQMPQEAPQLAKKQGLSWPYIESLLQRQMFDEAFTLILRSVAQTQMKGADLNNDSMMLIKALGKVGCKSPPNPCLV